MVIVISHGHGHGHVQMDIHDHACFSILFLAQAAAERHRTLLRRTAVPRTPHRTGQGVTCEQTGLQRQTPRVGGVEKGPPGDRLAWSPLLRGS